MVSKFSQVVSRASMAKTLFQRSSSSVQALLDQSAKSRQLPEEITLQVMDERHDLNQIRNLLARAFVVNNEPIINVLGEFYFPAHPPHARIPLMEERFKSLFCDESMSRKIEQGLSFVAVREKDPTKLVSVMFAEKYTGDVYKGESNGDPLCQTGLNLMKTVHEKAKPIIHDYALIRPIIFISHTATHPKYRALGVVENLSDTLRARHVNDHPLMYALVTSQRLANFCIQRYGMQVIAEVFYKHYQDKGHKIFAQLSEVEVSAKALILCL